MRCATAAVWSCTAAMWCATAVRSGLCGTSAAVAAAPTYYLSASHTGRHAPATMHDCSMPTAAMIGSSTTTAAAKVNAYAE
jgi:hypothetical protein